MGAERLRAVGLALFALRRVEGRGHDADCAIVARGSVNCDCVLFDVACALSAAKQESAELLYAAAPDLLAALERLADTWDRLGPPSTATRSGAPTAIQVARAAIAAAKGTR